MKTFTGTSKSSTFLQKHQEKELCLSCFRTPPQKGIFWSLFLDEFCFSADLQMHCELFCKAPLHHHWFPKLSQQVHSGASRLLSLQSSFIHLFLAGIWHFYRLQQNVFTFWFVYFSQTWTSLFILNAWTKYLSKCSVGEHNLQFLYLAIHSVSPE